MMRIKLISTLIITFLLMNFSGYTNAQEKKSFKVIAFYTAKDDPAHVSYVHEANRWFSSIAPKYRFEYDSTNIWDNLNSTFLSKYDIVIFLDTRPEAPEQRAAFETYMKNGGAWLGFHFAAFALPHSTYPQNWDWYHNEFLGSGEYKGNTWKPTAAVLKVEGKHPLTRNLPSTFKTSPNEWYSWKNNLRENSDIQIWLSVDSSSFPLGTGPKLHEIWHSGDYPVVWTNKKYRMVYVNMGHNDIDYEHGTNNELSFTFTNDIQNRLIINCLLWLAKRD